MLVSARIVHDPSISNLIDVQHGSTSTVVFFLFEFVFVVDFIVKAFYVSKIMRARIKINNSKGTSNLEDTGLAQTVIDLGQPVWRPDLVRPIQFFCWAGLLPHSSQPLYPVL